MDPNDIDSADNFADQLSQRLMIRGFMDPNDADNFADQLSQRLMIRGFMEINDPEIRTRTAVYKVADDLSLLYKFEVTPRQRALATLEKIASLPQTLGPWGILIIDREYDASVSQNMGAVLIDDPSIVFCFASERDAIYAQLCRD